MKGETMRNNLTQFIVGGALLVAALVPGAAYAQDSSQKDPNKSPAPTATQTPAPTPSQSPLLAINQADLSYSVSLVDGQTIPLNQNGTQGVQGQALATQAARTQFWYGGTASVVYMDNYAPTSIENTTAGVLSP